MKRFLVGGSALLAGLIVIGRVQSATTEVNPVEATGPSPVAPAIARTGASPVVPVAGAAGAATAAPAVSPPPDGPSRTPVIDLLARLEARRRLLAASRFAYFDSLFAETDSVVRRWSDPAPLIIGVVLAGPEFDAALLATVRNAASAWEAAVPAVRFKLSRDSTEAQLIAHSVDQLEEERVGLTDLEWNRGGAIQRARISLARRDRRGIPIPASTALAVAIHEIGHALGLPHSPNPDDVMFPTTRTGRLSPRDVATLRLLYELPTGSVRENAR